MRSRRIALTDELYRKIIDALASSLGNRTSVVEKPFETFLSDLLEHLAADRAMLGNLLSSGLGARENGPRLAQSPPEDR